MTAETLTTTSPLLNLPLDVQTGVPVGPQEGKTADLPKFEESDIRRVCKLGSGCHTNVYLVTTPSRQQLALKCLDSHTIPSQKLHASLTSDLLSEANILCGLDHENVIKIRGLSCAPRAHSGPSACDAVGSHPFFLMDVLSETLMDRVQRWSKDASNYKGVRNSFLGGRFRKLDLRKMVGRMETTAIGVASGMAYLHNKGIVLQDLKPANIGFDMQTGKATIFDLGMARHVLDLSINKPDETCGTPRYMAPEIMNGETATKASDVYSFGCVLYTLCTLQVPFHDFVAEENELEEFKVKIMSGERPCLKCIPHLQFRTLIADCWAQDPFDRPTFDEILEERLPTVIPLLSKTRKPAKRLDSGSSFGQSIHFSFRSDSGFTFSVKKWNGTAAA